MGKRPKLNVPRVRRTGVTKGTSVSMVTKLEAERHNREVREYIMGKSQLDLKEEGLVEHIGTAEGAGKEVGEGHGE